MQPSTFRVKERGDFIGPALKESGFIERLIEGAKEDGRAPIKVLILGQPGIGKSELAEFFCRCIGASKWSAHKYNGTAFKIDDVEELARSVHFTNLFGDYRVIRVEEIDKMPTVAQVRMLTLLDDLPPGNAVIATSNCTVNDLEPRFQSRFQVIQLKPPTEAEIIAFLSRRWEISTEIAKGIATFACGNVRQALLDAQTYLT